MLATASEKRNERKAAMIDKSIRHDQTENELLGYEVSDESLESAASTEKAGAYTLGFCTGLSDCPA
jgi:hypothetical protein